MQFGFKISPEVKPENPIRQPEPPTRSTRSAPCAARTRPCAARASPPGVRAARRAEDGVEIVDSRALICPLGLEPRARTREPVAGRLRPSRAFPRPPRCPASPKGSRGSKTGFAVVSRSWTVVVIYPRGLKLKRRVARCLAVLSRARIIAASPQHMFTHLSYDRHS